MVSIRKVVAGFFLVALAVAAVACGRRAHADMTDAEVTKRVEKGVAWVVDDLDGTDAQADAILAEVETLLPDFFALRAKKAPMRTALEGQLLGPNPNLDTVDTMVDELADDLTVVALKAAGAGVNVHGILTAEQRAEIADRFESSGKRWKKKRSRWMAEAVFDRGLDEIEATDEQVQYALEKRDELTKKAEVLKSRREQTRSFLLAQLQAERPDLGAIEAQVNDAATTYRAFAHEVAEAVVGFSQMLTPEQRKRAAEMMAEHRH